MQTERDKLLALAERRGPRMSRRYRVAMALLKLAEFVRPGTLGELGQAYIAVANERRAALRTKGGSDGR